MRIFNLLPVLAIFLLTSCGAIRINSDYDKTVDFSQYKTYAFHKNGIDKVEISDLDKRRILKAIDAEMTAKGFTKSETPDLLINIFTKEREEVNVNQFNSGWGYGWGWNPYFGGNTTTVTRNTKGTLYIDLIDSKKKELIWQGEGEGTLTKDTHKKEAVIQQFVSQILSQYPPVAK